MSSMPSSFSWWRKWWHKLRVLLTAAAQASFQNSSQNLLQKEWAQRYNQQYASAYKTALDTTITSQQKSLLRRLSVWMALRKMGIFTLGFVTFMYATAILIQLFILFGWELLIVIVGLLWLTEMRAFDVRRFVLFLFYISQLLDIATLQKFIATQKQIQLLPSVGGTHSSVSVSVFSASTATQVTAPVPTQSEK